MIMPTITRRSPWSFLARMPPWRFAAASVIGSSHLGSGLPCQDSWRVAICDRGPGRGTLIAAVSDGAGTAKHSDVGARVAADGVVQAALDRVAAKGAPLDAGDVRELLYEARERVLEAARRVDEPVREFACTLLLAVVTPERALLAQIGDGSIVLGGDGQWRCVFWPQHGEYANATTFLTDDDGVEGAQIDAIDAPPPEVALFTDGLERLVLKTETQTAHAPFFDAIFPPVRASAQLGPDDQLCVDLATYLASPAILERTDDDKTLVLATRLERSNG
jgi:hypothetical protein